MAHASPGPTRRTWLDCPVVATADRLVIRPPIAAYVVAGLFLLLAAVPPWVLAEVGLLDRGIRMPVSLMGAAGVLFFTALLCRGWSLDRTTDAVRYFPRRLCAVSAVRGVRGVERRVGKLNLGIAYTVDLELAGGGRVRFAGFSHFRLDRPHALALAAILGEWLTVPVAEEHLTPAA